MAHLLCNIRKIFVKNKKLDLGIVVECDFVI